jgi:hypothetical protein
MRGQPCLGFRPQALALGRGQTDGIEAIAVVQREQRP